MKSKSDLITERRELVQKGEALIDRVLKAGRDLTDDERDDLDEYQDGIKSITTQVDAIELRAAKSAELVSKLTGGYTPADPDIPAEASSDGYRGRQHWAKSVSRTLQNAGRGLGVKALLSGEVTTPPAVEVAPLPTVPNRLLDLVPREALTEHTFSYLRQVLRDDKAAVVADNALKPTSVYTFEEVEDRARVIAHLSEPFPLRYASDHASMMQVLDGQMKAGVYEAIERLIVSGSGTGEEWTGILNTTGVKHVSFTTDTITTLRKARTALELTGQPVTAVAMNPADIEALDLLREDGSTGGFLLDTDAYERIFGRGVRGVPSLSVPVGQAIAGNWDATRLMVRQDAHTLAATQAGDLFDKNQMKLRSEGRFGFKFTQPGALVVVDLTSA